MHATCPLHRDLNPHNVLLDERRQNLKIIGIGFISISCQYLRGGLLIEFCNSNTQSAKKRTVKLARAPQRLRGDLIPPRVKVTTHTSQHCNRLAAIPRNACAFSEVRTQHEVKGMWENVDLWSEEYSYYSILDRRPHSPVNPPTRTWSASRRHALRGGRFGDDTPETIDLRASDSTRRDTRYLPSSLPSRSPRVSPRRAPPPAPREGFRLRQETARGSLPSTSASTPLCRLRAERSDRRRGAEQADTRRVCILLTGLWQICVLNYCSQGDGHVLIASTEL